MKKLTAEKCCQLLDSLNSNGMSILEGYYVEALEIALPILEQQERPIEQVKCPFPCGWKELLRVAMNDGAFLSQKLIEGEEVRDIHRHAALSNTDRLVSVITAILDASEEMEQQERGEGWIEWGGGECPVPPGTIVDVRYRSGQVEKSACAWGWGSCPRTSEASSAAGAAFWENDSIENDIIAYRIIPEQPTNQNGEQ